LLVQLAAANSAWQGKRTSPRHQLSPMSRVQHWQQPIGRVDVLHAVLEKALGKTDEKNYSLCKPVTCPTHTPMWLI
jgi:hypothetical protein